MDKSLVRHYKILAKVGQVKKEKIIRQKRKDDKQKAR